MSGAKSTSPWHGNGDTIHRQLVSALESVRMQFAIAIAAETKSTPIARWRYYLDTADRMTQFIRKFRKADSAAALKHKEWMRALETLKRMPPEHGSASSLCRILQDLMTRLM